MKRIRDSLLNILVGALAIHSTLGQAFSAQAPRGFQVGYVYPAGGKQGSTFEVVVAGQFLVGASNVLISGTGVEAKITGIIRPLTQREINDLRIRIDELLARRAVVMKDFRALEQFRSFQKAKALPKDDKSEDEMIQELKRKYANATWTQEDERHLAELRRKLATGIRRPANPAISELVIAQVTIDANAPPGQRELRLATAAGVSNPLPFHVGRLAEYCEPASKQIPEQRSAVAGTATVRLAEPKAPVEVVLPTVINGQILPGEVDRYRFAARKGQRLVAVVQARELIPYIADAVPGWFQAVLALYDAEGKELAYADDFRFHPDPALYYEIPADGQYVLEIRDAIYRGREDFVYRITLGEIPYVTDVFPLGGPTGKTSVVELFGWNLSLRRATIDPKDQPPGIYTFWLDRKDFPAPIPISFAVDCLPESFESEPNNEPRQAQAVPFPQIVNGRIGAPDDCDVFAIHGKPGDTIVVEVCARRLLSPLDSLVKVTDSRGTLLAVNDDAEDPGAGRLTHYADSRLSVALPADGTCYVHVRDAQHRGGPEYAYRLRISPPQPDFALRVVPSAVNVRPGATATVTVYAVRKDGWAGPIQLRLKDAPSGFRLSGATIPAGEEKAAVTLSAPSSGDDKPYKLQIEGYATVAGQEIVRPAVPADDRMQAFAYHHLVPAQEFCAAVIGREWLRSMVKLLTPVPVRIPVGGTARVEIQLPAALIADPKDLAISEPPEGITLAQVFHTGATAEIVLRSDANKSKVGQKGSLALSVPYSSAPRTKTGAAIRRAAQAITLPPIPYEIVKK